jgi:vesicle-associated membrane protein 7
MVFIYASVVRATDEVVLTSWPLDKVDVYGAMVAKLIPKIKPKITRMSYVYEAHYFHYILDRGLVFLLVADDQTPRRVAFEFLEDVKQTFHTMYTEPVLTASLCSDFASVWRDKFATAESGDRVLAIKQELDKVKDVMVENVDRVVERGEKLEALLERTEELEAAAAGFQRSATALRRRTWWQARKPLLALLVLLLAFVLVYWLLS